MNLLFILIGIIIFMMGYLHWKQHKIYLANKLQADINMQHIICLSELEIGVKFIMFRLGYIELELFITIINKYEIVNDKYRNTLIKMAKDYDEYRKEMVINERTK